MSDYEMKVFKEFNTNVLERKYKKYMEEVKEKHGDDFSVSQWVELHTTPDNPQIPYIHMFVFLDIY